MHRSYTHAFQDMLAYMFNARMRSRVDFHHVHRTPFGNRHTRLARSARLGRAMRSLCAIETLGNQTRNGGFTDSARSGKQIRVRRISSLKLTNNGRLYMFLPNNIFKSLRTVFSIQIHGRILPQTIQIKRELESSPMMSSYC